ncbi:MAG: hypothetical protein CUR32_02965 [Flavobacterium sp.]|nr:MAG: hypothetical protein CUR32_02965 [Flavobacterium sp.] [Flavobacterium sp. FEMGT703F]
MRTITIISMLLFSVFIVHGQITINEKAIKTLSLDTTKNEVGKYNLNLKSFSKKIDDSTKRAFDSKLNQLNINLSNQEAVSITES